jgi:hypothetical protein
MYSWRITDMAQLGKGRIVQIKSRFAIIEDSETQSLKKDIKIPRRLGETTSIGDDVVYTYFNDTAGIILENLTQEEGE